MTCPLQPKTGIVSANVRGLQARSRHPNDLPMNLQATLRNLWSNRWLVGRPFNFHDTSIVESRHVRLLKQHEYFQRLTIPKVCVIEPLAVIDGKLIENLYAILSKDETDVRTPRPVPRVWTSRIQSRRRILPPAPWMTFDGFFVVEFVFLFLFYAMKDCEGDNELPSIQFGGRIIIDTQKDCLGDWNPLLLSCLALDSYLSNSNLDCPLVIIGCSSGLVEFFWDSWYSMKQEHVEKSMQGRFVL